MKTLTKLSARTLTYYISVRRWKTDLDFFDTEAGFYTRLMKDLVLILPEAERPEHTQIDEKIAALVSDKNKILQLLNMQLIDLESLAEDLVKEDKEALTGKQAHLEYQVNDLMHEFREIKRKYFGIITHIMDDQKQLVN